MKNIAPADAAALESHRNPRVARVARLRPATGRQRARDPAARSAACARAPGRPPPSVRGDDAVHQHDCAHGTGAVSGRPRHRAPDQEPGALERAGDGRPRQSRVGRHRRPHFDVRLVGDAVRGGVQSLLPRQGCRPRRRHHLFPGPRIAWNLRPGLPRRPHFGRAAAEFPSRAAADWRAVVLSASVADAGLLGVPDGLDGARPADGDLPGTLRAIPHESRPDRAGPIRRSGRSSATARRTSRKRWGRSHWPRARSSTT